MSPAPHDPEVQSTDAPSPALSRRALLSAATIGGAGLFAANELSASAAPSNGSHPAPHHAHERTHRLTVIGTTDLHGNVYNWDYFKNAAYSDRAGNNIGEAKCATLIKAVRDERGHRNCLTLDAGDTIQGTPLAYYYARVKPITQGHDHPMAVAMNTVGYDAAALGNHEFNYGIDILRAFQKQLRHPLLGANVLHDHSNRAAFPSFVLKRMHLTGSHEPVTVGILGLVTPGVAIWDKANLAAAKLHMNGIVEQARREVPRMKRAGADIVIVSCHSGATPSSSYGDALPWPENASTQLAQQVPGIDAILVGHAHLEVPQVFVTNEKTGKQVLLSEPDYWGMRVTVMDLDLQHRHGHWEVVKSASTLLNAHDADEDAEVAALVRPMHEEVLAYVNGVVGQSKQAMSASTSRFEDTPAIDFINYVQAQAVKDGIAGTQWANLPVLSIAAPFNAAAQIPAGDVTVRDVAGLYIYDNTLLGIVFTGAQVRAYLEFSAQYFKQVSGTGPFTASQVCNAVTASAPNGTPDYNYDIMGGLDARLTYDIDISQPTGSRIKNLAYAGKALDDSQQFVVAINNYRQSGGGGFPGVTTATVAYNRQNEIRQLLIDWVGAHKVIDASTFASTDWRLVSGGKAITVTA